MLLEGYFELRLRYDACSRRTLKTSRRMALNLSIGFLSWFGADYRQEEATPVRVDPTWSNRINSAVDNVTPPIKVVKLAFSRVRFLLGHC